MCVCVSGAETGEKGGVRKGAGERLTSESRQGRRREKKLKSKKASRDKRDRRAWAVRQDVPTDGDKMTRQILRKTPLSHILTLTRER